MIHSRVCPKAVIISYIISYQVLTEFYLKVALSFYLAYELVIGEISGHSSLLIERF